MADQPAPGEAGKAAAGLTASLKERWERLRAGSGTDFAALFGQETDQLEANRITRNELHQADAFSVTTGVSGEPWVSSAGHDRFGLALSGGGIRSATFNLGLLQALASLHVLKHVDYLSTVSGGGYIGGFWSRWLVRQKTAEPPRTIGPEHFPIDAASESGTGSMVVAPVGEGAEVRHLREFSRFLLPQLGVHRSDFWAVVMTIVGGLLPSVAAALAVLVLGWAAWLGIVHILTRPGDTGWNNLGLALIAFVVVSEVGWRRRQISAGVRTVKTDPLLKTAAGYLTAAAIGIFIAVLVWAFRADLPVVGDALTDWHRVAYWLAPAAAVGLSASVLLALRPLVGRFARDWQTLGVAFIAGFERSLSRQLGLMALALALGSLWSAGQLMTGLAVPVTAGSVGILAAVFSAVRRWLAEPLADTRGSRLTEVVLSRLKRATPRVLATLVWLLLTILVAATVRSTLPEGSWLGFRQLVTAAVVILGLTMWWFDPARVGLHEFYRSRISRCFLGASNVASELNVRDRTATNRRTSEHPLDDMTLQELREARVKPIHLVCTAANDLSGDHLASLYRGAKSAVLSPNGISIGNQAGRLDYLRFSAALTASAAAFNSQMGQVSMSLGPSVAFLMSALNLRLGLWVPHPSRPSLGRPDDRGDYTFPGRFFIRELLGRSRADDHHLHLSDGAHFDNLALYELVRRHCRWIIVSDCGADPSVKFDDLANVLRRVREDFGVEIDLDVRPLRPDADGMVQQHAVVGTIHYDGQNGVDKGTILLIKPGMTGDEPADITNYRTRVKRFPHESTGDQFFDEAQWESYRRLGEHVGWGTLGFAQGLNHETADFNDRLFTGIRERLHPAVEGHRDKFLEMSARCADLEADLCSNGPRHLCHELFPEAARLPDDGDADDIGMPPTRDDEVRAISFLMRAIQIMEDVWLVSDLDRYWSHPLNEGWMNYFQRWASTPTFRRWWPILRPIYSNGFREFAKARFSVGPGDPVARPGSDRLSGNAVLSLTVERDHDRFWRGLAWRQFVQRSRPPALDGLTVLAYQLRLADGVGGLSDDVIDVGFVLATEDGRSASVLAPHFYIPPALIGSGISGRQLDALLHHYEGLGFTRLSFLFDALPRDPAARGERVRMAEFFRSRGFEPESEGESGEVRYIMTLPRPARRPAASARARS